MTAAVHEQYPWTRPAWERVTAAVDALHHGLLITGVPGIAKREFAVALGRLLLCDGPAESSRPCGGCRNCVLFDAATHPDFHVLTTESEYQDGRVELITGYCDRYQNSAAREKRANPGRVIPVDQVRLLIERFAVHPHSAARKVALIVPADRMNVNAANALLKLLEEPSADATLLLVSAAPGELPATVRSRCLHLPLPPPTPAEAKAWLGNHLSAKDAARALAVSSGGPVDALAMHNEGVLDLHDEFLGGVRALAGGRGGALELAARLARHDFLRVLDRLHRFTCDLIREACGAGDAQSGLDAAGLSAEGLFALYDKIGQYRRIAREQFNEQLALEELTLALQRAVRG